MMEALLRKGVTLSVFDPEAMPNIKKRFGDKLNYASSMYAALEVRRPSDLYRMEYF